MNIVILDHGTLTCADLTPLKQLTRHLTCFEHTQPQQILERCKDAQVIITNKVVLDQDTINQLPHLTLICIAATGTNNVDLNAAKAKGVAVCNVAGYSTASVVQHTFSLLFNLLGNTHRYLSDCQQGLWQKSTHFCRLDHSIDEVADKTIAIIGYGELGQAMAKVAEAFAMNVLIAERRDQPPRAGRVSFEEAISQADIVSLHCPLAEHTYHLIDEPEFALMKPSAVLLNTARGGIVNEQALCEALEKKIIAAAAVDVLSQEPAQADNPLMTYKQPNLLLTPHIAWASTQSVNRLIGQIALNITAFYQHQPRNRVV
ncbi:glycerate dehydrogenase [Pseudoalteromonas ulvae UL12]|uniref:D-2-hydroxyacid dehydrogenase n=1 Tax=Pseudoalteromonas ulvae TaxID=107327 RepID=UPI00186B9DE3|nr:D-2-hydroxyacid dehydrogenase [Pseudoalteromonas ulvae]MBE0365374.1 glycerate dehydrogenase [Pseudoalteromonas ulvae UL12]